MQASEYAYLPKGGAAVVVGDVPWRGPKVILPYEIKCMPKSMRRHGDLSFAYLGRGTAVCAPESFEYYREALSGVPVRLVSGARRLGGTYPCDSAYNVATIGDKVFCRVDATDEVLLREAQGLGFRIINIKQGYAKCSVCPVTQNAAISADPSFLKAARQNGVDCLEVTNSGIRLDGFKNGFFGGAVFMKDKRTLSSVGDLSRHPDFAGIKEFLKRYDIEAESGTGEPRDVGSVSVIAVK